MGESNKITELGGVVWILLAQYRDLWQAVVNHVMKVESQNCKEFLTRRLNVTCSKRTLFHGGSQLLSK
jgi:hypothetical protein